MDETTEVVICHDILAVPYENTTQYIWAATQTFTIKHLKNDNTDDEGAELKSYNTASVANDRNSNIANENVTIYSENKLRLEGEKVITNGDADYVEPVSLDIEYNTALTESKLNPDRDNTVAIYDGNMSEHFNDDFDRRRIVQEEEQAQLGKDIRAKRKKTKSKERRKNHLTKHENNQISAATAQYQSPELNYKNYPITNNDRLSLSPQPSQLPAPATSSSPKYLNHNSSRSSSEYIVVNKYNSNHINNLIIRELKNPQSQQQTVKEWRCAVCDIKFVIEMKMHEHLLRHFGYYRMLDTFKCVFCGEIFRNCLPMSQHLLEHYMNMYPKQKESFK